MRLVCLTCHVTLVVGVGSVFSQSLPVRTDRTEIQRTVLKPEMDWDPADLGAIAKKLGTDPATVRLSARHLRQHLFPVRNSVDARIFFAEYGLSAAEQVRLTATTERGTLAAELLSDFLGPIRISFGAVLSKSEGNDETDANSSSSSSDETLDTLLAGGGNTYLAFAWPFIQWSSKEKGLGMVGYVLPRYGLVLPALGSETDEVLQSVEPALEIHVQAKSLSKVFEFFLQGRFGRTFVSEDLEDVLETQHGDFTLGQWTAGFTMGEYVRVSFTGGFGSPDELGENLPTKLSFQIIRPAE
jgi:hypothetical protein